MGEHIYKGRKLELLIPASSLEVLKIAVSVERHLDFVQKQKISLLKR